MTIRDTFGKRPRNWRKYSKFLRAAYFNSFSLMETGSMSLFGSHGFHWEYSSPRYWRRKKSWTYKVEPHIHFLTSFTPLFVHADSFICNEVKDNSLPSFQLSLHYSPAAVYCFFLWLWQFSWHLVFFKTTIQSETDLSGLNWDNCDHYLVFAFSFLITTLRLV